MSEIPGDLKFLKSHEWARVEDNGQVTVGISDHAQGLLGDLVYVELPGVGDAVTAGAAVAVVESVKAASDVYAPVSGKVVAVNEALSDKPETINEDAYGDGWILVVQPDDPSQLEELLSRPSAADVATQLRKFTLHAAMKGTLMKAPPAPTMLEMSPMTPVETRSSRLMFSGRRSWMRWAIRRTCGKCSRISLSRSVSLSPSAVQDW